MAVMPGRMVGGCETTNDFLAKPGAFRDNMIVVKHRPKVD
jgi:hypothetical protein